MIFNSSHMRVLADGDHMANWGVAVPQNDLNVWRVAQKAADVGKTPNKVGIATSYAL